MTPAPKRSHPRRRRRPHRRLAHDGLERLQPAQPAQPGAAREGPRRRAGSSATPGRTRWRAACAAGRPARSGSSSTSRCVRVHRPGRRCSSCAGVATGLEEHGPGADAHPADARGAGALRRARALGARRRLHHVLHRGRRPAVRGGPRPGPAVRAHRVRRRPRRRGRADRRRGRRCAPRRATSSRSGTATSRSSRGTRPGRRSTGPDAQAALALPRAVRPPRGWRAGLESVGSTGRGSCSGAGGSDAAGGARAAAALLDRADRPTAILALSDVPRSASSTPRPSAGSSVPASCPSSASTTSRRRPRRRPASRPSPSRTRRRAAPPCASLVSGAGRGLVLLPCELVVRASTAPAPR